MWRELACVCVGQWTLVPGGFLDEVMPVRRVAGGERLRNGDVARRALGSYSRAVRRGGAGSALGV